MKSHEGHISPIERPLGRGELSARLDTKGELAVFSLTAVLQRVLQDRTARDLIIATSEKWKTGELYQQKQPMPNFYMTTADTVDPRDSLHEDQLENHFARIFDEPTSRKLRAES